MNIDSLPLTAFALESSGATSLSGGTVHTLTLTADASLPEGATPLGGQVRITADQPPSAGLPAAVAVELPTGLTLTF